MGKCDPAPSTQPLKFPHFPHFNNILGSTSQVSLHVFLPSIYPPTNKKSHPSPIPLIDLVVLTEPTYLPACLPACQHELHPFPHSINIFGSTDRAYLPSCLPAFLPANINSNPSPIPLIYFINSNFYYK